MAVSQAMADGRPLTAYDLAAQGLQEYSDSSPLGVLSVRALLSCGSIIQSADALQRVIPAIPSNDPLYVEAISLAGRIEKMRWQRVSGEDLRKISLSQAINWYRIAYQVTGNYFPGINLASLLLIQGDSKSAQLLARQISTQCIEACGRESRDKHWAWATLGESALITGDTDTALRCYVEARRICDSDLGSLASICRQLIILAPYIPAASEILSSIRPGPVVAFVGHMIDAPGRPTPRFPAAMESEVRSAIQVAIDQTKPSAVYCSAACGADILFAEETIRRGIELNIFLPFLEDEFTATSVSFAGQEWATRFREVLSRAATVRYSAEEGYLGHDDMFLYCNDFMLGSTCLRAAQIEAEPWLLAALDHRSESKVGGTTATLSAWKSRGGKVIEIKWPTCPAQQTCKEPANTVTSDLTVAVRQATPCDSNCHDPLSDSRRVRAMLFADVSGFSKLAEHQAPAFFRHFIDQVADLIDEVTDKPVFANTWGDGLFMVFEEAAAAAEFSLRMRDAIHTKDWRKLDLPDGVVIRTGLHAGPVFSAFDRIVGRTNYFGTHVNRAARIEPVAVPGMIFVSDQFAALLAGPLPSEYVCDYVGNIEMAKQFGSMRAYSLRRTQDVN